jgi:hypothetical protein
MVHGPVGSAINVQAWDGARACGGGSAYPPLRLPDLVQQPHRQGQIPRQITRTQRLPISLARRLHLHDMAVNRTRRRSLPADRKSTQSLPTQTSLG